jgi:porin
MAALVSDPAFAQDAKPDENGITSPSIATSLPNNGDPGGIRKRLAEHGITYNLCSAMWRAG